MVDGIIIFDMGTDFWSRVASGAVLIQAIAQYLVTLNIWSHNILLLLARRRAAKAGVPCQVMHKAEIASLWLVHGKCALSRLFVGPRAGALCCRPPLVRVVVYNIRGHLIRICDCCVHPILQHAGGPDSVGHIPDNGVHYSVLFHHHPAGKARTQDRVLCLHCFDTLLCACQLCWLVFFYSSAHRGLADPWLDQRRHLNCWVALCAR